MNVNTIIRLNDRIFLINEANSTNMYLVIGEKKALLIDTGYGYGDTAGDVKKLTDKDVTVAITHGHPDHGLGAYEFSEVYLNQRDLQILKSSDNPNMKRISLEYRLTKVPELFNQMDVDQYCRTDLNNTVFKPMNEGDIFDLGDLKLRVIEIPGHSPGSVALFEENNGWLFTGDLITKHNIWNQASFPDDSMPLSVMMKSLKKIELMKDQITAIYPAHDITPIGTEIIGELEEAVRDLPKHYQNDAVIHTMVGDAYKHDYKGRVILYSKELLKETLENGVE